MLTASSWAERQGFPPQAEGDFYYTDTPSFRKYFGKFAEKYHFKGAFAGMHSPFRGPEERWGYVATFLHTTLHAPLRAPYRDLDILLKGKDFHILTTNQDTQFVKLYPESDVSEIQAITASCSVPGAAAMTRGMRRSLLTGCLRLWETVHPFPRK